MPAPGAYQTIFEIGFRSFPWSAFLSPVLFILLGIASYRFSTRQFFKVFGLIGSAFGFLIVLVICVSLVPNYIRSRNTYKNGQTKVIEGTVENFRPMPPLGPTKESFSVGGVSFSYFVGDNSPCFTNGPMHKGPIYAGLNVRIYYNDGCIQRVDVRR